MADLEDGYTRIANEILERMATVKLSPTQYRLLFVVWRYTYGFKRKRHELSLKFLSESTGCDKRQIQRELKDLEDRRIITQSIDAQKRRMIGFNKNCNDWSKQRESIGETTNTPIGETVNTKAGGIGETTNISIGETTNRGIGETTNQERKILKKERKLEEEEEALTPEKVIALSNEIENHFVMRRGRGFHIDNDDYNAIRQAIVDGIPVDVINRCIDSAFEEYKPKHRLDYIKSIKYCLPRAYDEWLRIKRELSITENVPSEPVALGQANKSKSSRHTQQMDLLKSIIEEEESNREQGGSRKVIHDHKEYLLEFRG